MMTMHVDFVENDFGSLTQRCVGRAFEVHGEVLTKDVAPAFLYAIAAIVASVNSERGSNPLALLRDRASGAYLTVTEPHEDGPACPFLSTSELPMRMLEGSMASRLAS
jgi:hypothetical protein